MIHSCHLSGSIAGWLDTDYGLNCFSSSPVSITAGEVISDEVTSPKFSFPNM